MGCHRETQRVADYIGGVSKNTGLHRHVKGCQGQRLARNAVNNMVFVLLFFIHVCSCSMFIYV